MTASQYKEFKGTDVDKAVEIAVKELGVERDKLRYDVLSFGSSGVFGIVPARKAKIRVPLLEEKTGKTKKKRSSKSKQKDVGASENGVDPLFEAATEPAEEKTLLGPPKKKKGSNKKANAPAPSLKEASPKEASASKKKKNTDPKESAPAKKAAKTPASAPLSAESVDLQTNTELAEMVLRRMLSYLAPEAELKTNATARKSTYFISGGDNSHLLSNKAKSLEAIRYLLEKILHRGTEEQRLRVEIDVDDYAKKKREKLVDATLAVIEKCQQTQEKQVLGRLSAKERRVVQLILKKHPDILATLSGSGDKRTMTFACTSSPKTDSVKSKDLAS